MNSEPIKPIIERVMAEMGKKYDERNIRLVCKIFHAQRVEIDGEKYLPPRLETGESSETSPNSGEASLKEVIENAESK